MQMYRLIRQSVSLALLDNLSPDTGTLLLVSIHRLHLQLASNLKILSLFSKVWLPSEVTEEWIVCNEPDQVRFQFEFNWLIPTGIRCRIGALGEIGPQLDKFFGQKLLVAMLENVFH